MFHCIDVKPYQERTVNVTTMISLVVSVEGTLRYDAGHHGDPPVGAAGGDDEPGGHRDPGDGGLQSPGPRCGTPSS